MTSERRWASALAEHEQAVSLFVATCERVPAERWHERPAPGKWSPAAVALHVCQAYLLGSDAAKGGPGMRLRVAPSRAWVLRTFLLPLMLWSKRFPHGVPAPAEVRPDESESELLSVANATTRLRHAATEASTRLRRAADEATVPRVTHAYFGALVPHAALRLLSAHTNHHSRELARTLALTSTRPHPAR